MFLTYLFVKIFTLWVMLSEVQGWIQPSYRHRASTVVPGDHDALDDMLTFSTTKAEGSVLFQESRRSVLMSSVTSLILFHGMSSPAFAATSDKPREFQNVGTQAPAPAGEAPFVTLPSGVQIKDFRLGSGDASVTATSTNVQIQAKGRLLNLNGVVFYDTKTNDPDGFGAVPLTLNLGQNTAIPGFEQGLVGMKKGGIRRIIIPQDLAYNGYPDREPKPTNSNDQRALDSVVKNSRRDGAILFDVSLERFK